MNKPRSRTTRNLMRLARLLQAHETLTHWEVSRRVAGKADFVRVIERANPAIGRLARYRLVRDTGPLPPERRRVTVTVDPNLGEYVRLPELGG